MLLPAAGIVDGRGLTVIVGRSRAGKSTLAARVIVAGGQMLGDDQILATRSGGWQSFPRRLRFYPDIRETAPSVWGRLPVRRRGVLVGRRALERITRGAVRPSLAIAPDELGGRWDPATHEATRIVLLERGAEIETVDIEEVRSAEAVAWAQSIIAEQRARLVRHLSPDWLARLDRVPPLEQDVLGHAIEGVPVLRVRLPGTWPAPRAVAAAARALGFAG